MLESINIKSNIYEEYKKAPVYFSSLENIVTLLVQWVNANGGHERVVISARFIEAYMDTLDSSAPKELQALLLQLITNSKGLSDSVVRLIAELENQDLFSFFNFLSMHVASGLWESEHTKDDPVIQFVFKFPTKLLAPRHLSQRSSVLSRLDKELVQKESTELLPIQNYIQGILCFDKQGKTDILVHQIEPTILSSIQSLSLFGKNHLSYWLRDYASNYIYTQNPAGLTNWRQISTPGFSMLNKSQFSFVIYILELLDAYHVIVQLIIWLIDKTSDKGVIKSLTSTLKRHQLIIHFMGYSNYIFDMIWDKYHGIRRKGGHVDRNMLLFMQHFSQALSYPLTDEQSSQILKDLELIKKKKQSSTRDLPSEFKDIRDLKNDPSNIASAISNLYWKYSNKNAIKKLIHYTIALLQNERETLSK